MGTDIHVEVFAKVKNPDWHTEKGIHIIHVPPPPYWVYENDSFFSFRDYSWPDYRSYRVFRKLCINARDNYGDYPAPPEKGLPDWIKTIKDEKTNDWVCYELEGNKIRLDLGDHTFSWLSYDELDRMDWEETDDDGETYTQWPKTHLLPLLKKVKDNKHVLDVYVVFGFDS